jgi:hypothetical protein
MGLNTLLCRPGRAPLPEGILIAGADPHHVYAQGNMLVSDTPISVVLFEREDDDWQDDELDEQDDDSWEEDVPKLYHLGPFSFALHFDLGKLPRFTTKLPWKLVKIHGLGTALSVLLTDASSFLVADAWIVWLIVQTLCVISIKLMPYLHDLGTGDWDIPLVIIAAFGVSVPFSTGIVLGISPMSPEMRLETHLLFYSFMVQCMVQGGLSLLGYYFHREQATPSARKETSHAY